MGTYGFMRKMIIVIFIKSLRFEIVLINIDSLPHKICWLNQNYKSYSILKLEKRKIRYTKKNFTTKKSRNLNSNIFHKIYISIFNLEKFYCKLNFLTRICKI